MSLFTLIVPTYNRPGHLARLLKFLSAHRVNFPILILDSSRSEIQKINAEFAEKIELRIRHIKHATTIEACEKFLSGVDAVETPYSAFCADDDVVIPLGLQMAIEFLERNREYSAAHGSYFDFSEGDGFVLHRLCYWRNTLTANGVLERIVDLLRDYEATCYAVHRTKSLHRGLELASRVQPVFWQEICRSLGTILNGKVARLPCLSYGRNNGPSSGFSDWHPLQIISRDVEALFRQYFEYRNVVMSCPELRAESDLRRLLDLAHLRYFSPQMPSPVVDFLIEGVLEGQDGSSLEKSAMLRWTVPPTIERRASSPEPVPIYPKSLELFRRFRSAWDVLTNQPTPLIPPVDEITHEICMGGAHRMYRICEEFRADLQLKAQLQPDQEIIRLIETLNAFGPIERLREDR